MINSKEEIITVRFLSEYLHFKIFEKQELNRLLKEKFSQAYDESENETIVGADHEITTDIDQERNLISMNPLLNDKMREQLNRNLELIKKFYVPQKFKEPVLKNKIESISQYFDSIFEYDEFQKLIDYVNNNINIDSFELYKKTILEFEECVKEERNIIISNSKASEVSKDAAAKIMKCFSDTFKSSNILEALFSRLRNNDKNADIYEKLLMYLNKFFSSIGIYTPMDVVFGDKYDPDVQKDYSVVSVHTSNTKMQSMIMEIERLPYSIDYYFRNTTKTRCVVGNISVLSANQC